jgi:GT2 family glycosyltransferase
MKIPKILISAPTSINKRYCDAEFISHAKAFSYPNKEIFLVDNSPTPHYSEELKELGVDVAYVNPKGRPLKETMTICNNIIRDKVLNEKIDYLFSLETDHFPPTNILEVLVSYDKPVVSIPYFIGHGSERHLLLRTLVESKIDTQKLIESQLSFLDGFFFVNGQLNQIYSCGIGAMLVKREVLEKVSFRTQTDNHTDCHADTFFNMDIYKAGFDNMSETSLLSWHYNSDWGTVIDRF